MSDDYEETIEGLTSKLTDLLAIKNKETNYTSGYIGLIIRDSSIGNIDIIHNCTTVEDIITILQTAISQLKTTKK